MPKYRKKPVVIEAVQWQGQDLGTLLIELEPYSPDCVVVQQGDAIDIVTLEGARSADHGDWIIKSVNRELYPCKPDIFAKTYEPADAQ